MGIRGTIIFIAAIVTIIASIFTGNYSEFKPAVGIIILFIIIAIVSNILNRSE
jgi:hypothetical protein